jgi:hypothetical protein
MARTAQGKYFRSTDSASLAKAYQEIDRLAAIKTNTPSLRPQIFYYHWVLLILIMGYCITLSWRLAQLREERP